MHRYKSVSRRGLNALRLKLPLVAAVLAAVLPQTRAAERPADQVQIPAPGWTGLQFEPPEAGSYQLPVIAKAGNGRVVDSQLGDTTLHAFMGDNVVVLSFIYSSCSDANGCPLATHVLAQLKSRLFESPDGTNGVRFLSLSFDPVQDTPDVMRRYGKPFIDERLDWRFLTTRGQEDLAPVLESYGQYVTQEPGGGDGGKRSISHVLRVYLIDPGLRIRNIYSASFLHADTMFNDIRTLQDEFLAQPPQPSIRQRPGDGSEVYEGDDNHARPRSFGPRLELSAQLMAYRDSAPLGLPPIPEPPGNSVTRQKADLGRLLFFDRRLSHNNTISCAMCHVPEQGFTSNEMATAVGLEGQTVRRNTPTIYNVAYLEKLFLDGRETSLEQQVWGPLLAANEMGNPSVGQVLETIRSIPGYLERFESAFNGRSPTMETVGMALASYERLLVSADSRFDRWYYGGEADALSADEQAGFRLFTGKAGCSSCHLIGPDWALFTDNQMHNTGVGYRRSMSRPPIESRVQIAPGEFINVRREAIEEASERPPNDLGLYEITGRPEDRWKYRTPGLRNIELTAPYMHDGSILTLMDVVRFYVDGGVENPLRDPLVRPLALTQADQNHLVAFLRSLTGSNVDSLVADAFAVPVGNTGYSPGLAVRSD